MNPYLRLRDYFIGNYLRNTDNIFDRARIQLMFDYAAILLVTVIPFQITLWFAGYNKQFYLNLFPIALLLILFVLMKRGVAIWIIGALYCFLQIANSYGHAILYNFGVSVQGILWMLMGVLVAFFVLGARGGLVAMFFFVFYIVFATINRDSGYKYFHAGFNSGDVMLEGSGYLLVPLLLNAYILWLMARLGKRAEHDLTESNRKNQELLLNILPEETARELKESGKSPARLYNEVTVLFTDFVNFTGISEQMGPTDLVNEINRCFEAFDKIAEQNGLEKIKTIGDAYMAVCGLPHEDAEHAIKVTRAAKQILDWIAENHSRFQIRIGVNSGPVVAGIVGVKKYAYDIWGDTVNTAARMEQNSETGRINISGTTYILIKEHFECEYRGKLPAKNKGDVDMYFVK